VTGPAHELAVTQPFDLLVIILVVADNRDHLVIVVVESGVRRHQRGRDGLLGGIIVIVRRSRFTVRCGITDEVVLVIILLVVEVGLRLVIGLEERPARTVLAGTIIEGIGGRRRSYVHGLRV